MPDIESHIVLGFSCNCSCKHCVVQIARAKAEQNNISDLCTEEAMKTIQTAIKNGATKIVLSGGEPTMHDDIVLLVNMVLEHGIKLQIQTNGINTNVILNILEHTNNKQNLLEFMIPLHGDSPESHERVNNHYGSFLSTHASLKHIMDRNGSIIGKIICTKYGGQQIAGILRAYQQYQSKAVIIAYPHCVSFPDNLVFETNLEKCDAINLFQSLVNVNLPMPVILQGFPRCFLGNYHDERIFFQEEMADFLNTLIVENKQHDITGVPWHEYRRKEKTKFKYCNVCSHNTICEGIWMEYTRVYGS